MLKENICNVLLILISFNLNLQSTFGAIITYIYDNLNRLTRVVYGNGMIEEFTYDAAGNRLTHMITPSDSTPPTPNPMKWATVPYPTRMTSIVMVATTASDLTAPINYFLKNRHILGILRAQTERRLPAVLSVEEVRNILACIKTRQNQAYLSTV